MLNWLLTHTPLLYFTQSLWRDEAFSILAAERPISFFFTRLTFEPPVYYILLHFWMKIFGSSEIATRSLSFLAFVIATLVVIKWSEKLFKKHFLSWLLPFLFFFNPMLLYYAFEVRAYAWYVLFAVLSMYTYLEKKWLWYILTTTLGFYTHTYFIFVPLVEAIHWFITRNFKMETSKLKFFLREPVVRSLLAVGLLISPWIIKIVTEFGRLKSSWYYPVNFSLVKSVLGNMFLGYEGTPWYLWRYTAYLSLVLLALFLFALRPKTTRRRNILFFLMVVIPLTLVIGISFIKPLFVNRYLIPVTIAEIFLLAFAIETMRPKVFQTLFAIFCFLFIVSFNVWYPKEHTKLNIRSTIMEVNMLRDSDDVVFADSPLIFFETIYYSNDRKKVFLYNPSGSPFPWYVGDAIVSPSQITGDLPSYPIRAFVIHQDGRYDIAYRAPSQNHETE